MTPARTAILAVAALAATAAPAAARPAWRQVGPCRLHASAPRRLSATAFQGNAAADTCGGFLGLGQHDFTVETCVQYWTGGEFRNVPGSCSSFSARGLSASTDSEPIAAPHGWWLRTLAWVSIDHRYVAETASGTVLS